MNDLTFFQGAMLVFQVASALGIGTLIVLAFKAGRWMGEVNRDRKNNITEHLRFDRDIREIRVGPRFGD